MVLVGLGNFIFTFSLPIEMWFKIKFAPENVARNILKVTLCFKDFMP